MTVSARRMDWRNLVRPTAFNARSEESPAAMANLTEDQLPDISSRYVFTLSIHLYVTTAT